MTTSPGRSCASSLLQHASTKALNRSHAAAGSLWFPWCMLRSGIEAQSPAMRKCHPPPPMNLATA